MLKGFLSTMLIGALAAVTLSSCGDSKARGTGEFATVYATVTNPAVAKLDSDVATWVDATTGAAAPVPCVANTAVMIPAADVLSFNVTSTPYASTNTGQSSTSGASNLVISKVTLTLTPANTISPALPAMFANQPNLTAGFTISPGGSQSIPVVVVNQQLKMFMRDTTQLGALALSCANNPIYSYLAVVTFEALEVTTNRVSTIISAPVLINISDFAD